MTNVNNTSPLIKDGKKLTRRFLGNLFPTNSMETKELKAYTKGHDQFTHGRRFVKGFGFMPAYHDVRQRYFYK